MPNNHDLLTEIAALYGERKKKAEEVAAIDRRIELLLYPQQQTKRKSRPKSGKEWERIIENEHITTKGRALAG